MANVLALNRDVDSRRRAEIARQQAVAGSTS